MLDAAFNGFDALLILAAIAIVTANHLYETHKNGDR